jgi:hypothetical protein
MTDPGHACNPPAGVPTPCPNMAFSFERKGPGTLSEAPQARISSRSPSVHSVAPSQFQRSFCCGTEGTLTLLSFQGNDTVGLLLPVIKDRLICLRLVEVPFHIIHIADRGAVAAVEALHEVGKVEAVLL